MAGMKRVLVMGSAGAGKTTFALRLGRLVGLEVIHLDRHFWNSGWVETPPDEWNAKLSELSRRESWIMDGNYSSTLEIRLAVADNVIFLDFNRFTCLFRVLKRYVMNRGKSRPDISPGCQETLDWEFIKWIWNFPKRSRTKVFRLLEEFGGNIRVSILRNPKDVEMFLEEVASAVERQEECT